MLSVLLAEAELELVPADIAGHPIVRRHAKAQGKKPGQLLLDANHHQPAMKELPDAARRGRPDITQLTLLALLESPLNKDGGLRVALHTRHGELLHIRPDTRLPRGEARFAGLLAKVLSEGASQKKEPLLWVEEAPTPEAALAAFAQGPVLRLDEAGEAKEAWHLRDASDDGGDLTLVLGAYPAGDWSAAWQAAAPTTVSLYGQPLVAGAIAAEAAAGWRRAHASD